MRVLHVFGQMNRGGAEMRTVELMPPLAREGVRFDFCTLSAGAGELDERIRRLGGEVRPCPLRPNLLSFPRRFLALLKDGRYDVVHSHVHLASGYIVRLAHKAKVKGRIVHFRTISDGKGDNLYRRGYRRLMRVCVNRHATAILAVCKGSMEKSWGENWQAEPRCQVIYNGLDLSVFDSAVADRARLLAELAVGPESILIINVGRFNRAKAHDVLLKAAQEIIVMEPSAHLILAGDGPLLPGSRVLARTLGIEQNVHFLGRREDVPALLKASDCFALSSRREGLPGVVLEALAAGLPIVATDLPGVREIAEYADMAIVPVENPHILAQQLLQAIGNGRLRRSTRQAFPEMFDLRRCAEKLLTVYLQQAEQA